MYIELHKSRQENEKQYREYLDYVTDKNQLPMDKVLSKEEFEIEQQINNAINRSSYL